MNLERRIESIGKRCFDNCYEVAVQKGDDLTLEDLIYHDPQLVGTSVKSLRTRLHKIKSIIRAGRGAEALAIAKDRRRV